MQSLVCFCCFTVSNCNHYMSDYWWEFEEDVEQKGLYSTVANRFNPQNYCTHRGTIVTSIGLCSMSVASVVVKLYDCVHLLVVLSKVCCNWTISMQSFYSWSKWCVSRHCGAWMCGRVGYLSYKRKEAGHFVVPSAGGRLLLVSEHWWLTLSPKSQQELFPKGEHSDY